VVDIPGISILAVKLAPNGVLLPDWGAMRVTVLYAVPPLSTISSPNLWYSSKAAQKGSVTLAGELLDGRTEKLREELRTEVGG
jgi:hypothetical protein